MSAKLTLLCGAILSLSAGATSLATLISSTDGVVVGTEFNPTQVDHAFTFHLTVDRVLSGNVPNGTTLNVVWNSRTNAPARKPLTFLSRNMVLEEGADGDWECISAGSTGNAEFFPELSLPVSDAVLPAELAYDPAATPLEDQILLEMVAASPEARPNRWVLLTVASGMRTPGALRAFRYVAKSKTLDQAVMGSTLLLQTGDASALLGVEALAAQLTPEVSGSLGLVNTVKFLFQSTDPVVIASLGRMATSDKTDPSLRDASASALARIHSAEAVPWLGSLLSSNSRANADLWRAGAELFCERSGHPVA